jgi:nucleotide-binding universal stress UspA family protein
LNQVIVVYRTDKEKVEGSTTMFQCILVPLDGSPRVEHALPIAARLARASGGRITLLRAVPLPSAFA